MDNIKKQKVEGVKSSSTKKRKTSDEEKQWFDTVYEYVKNSIFELDPKLNLPKYAVIRLRGMAQGHFVGKDREKYDLTYGYRVVLATFQKMAPLIKYGLQHKTFNNQQHRINWVFAIVEPHLNDVYQEEEINRIRIENLVEQSDKVFEDVERYQRTNNYLNLQSEFAEAKTWDKKHEDMW